MTRKVLLGTIAGLLITIGIQAQPIATALDTFYTRMARNGQLNGNVLVAENGKIIYQKSFGYADHEQKRLNTADTEFNIASISKIFTATAILQLYEKKKLTLDQTYTHYFPEFPYNTISIRQILSHSSGLSDHDLNGIYDNIQPGAINNQDVIHIIATANRKLKLQPNEKWWYANIGYALLAALVEKLSGEPFHQYIERHIFKPAGMTHTYLKGKDINTNRSPLLAANYDYERMYNNTRKKIEGEHGYYTNNGGGASNVVSTTGDLLRFDIALRQGKLLKPATQKIAGRYTHLRDGSPNYVWKNIGAMGNAYDGLGWFVFGDSTAGKIIWHGGGMPGCATLYLRNLTRNQVVIVLDNHSSEGLYRTTLAGMRILNNQPYLYPKQSLARHYGKVLHTHGPDHAYTLLRQSLADTTHYNVNENDMNNLGYAFLENSLLPQALEVFKLNTLLYPTSDNTFNSYAEALLQANLTNDAIAMFKHSLLLNPNNTDSQHSLQTLLNKN